jgi:hypothetical protein
MTTRSISIALGLFVAAFSATPAAASLPTPASGGTWGPNQRVEYRWKEGSEPPAWARAAMNAAAADSNGSRRAKAAIFSYDANGPAWLAYTDDIPTNWAIGYAVRNMPHSYTIRLRPHGTQLDWGTLRWCQFYDDPPNGCYDLETITLHEFGHAQSLGHVNEADTDDWTDSVMHASGRSKAKAGWNQHVFGRCDVARLQIRYEPLTSSTPISTCLDLPTDLSLSPGNSSIGYGASVTLTAKLKIGADAIYPNLAGGPLTGRSVVLQRRALGSSSWTTIGALSAVTDGTGRYVKTLSLTTTYDWRAVFSAPGDEGLDGAVSNVSRLSVTDECTPTNAQRGPGPLYETC